MFKCSICGKEYDTPVGRAKCEIECDKANKAKAEAERQEKLKAEQKARADEVEKAYAEYVETCKSAKEKFENIRKKYNEDYSYEFNPKYIYFNDFFDNIDKLFRL